MKNIKLNDINSSIVNLDNFVTVRIHNATSYCSPNITIEQMLGSKMHIFIFEYKYEDDMLNDYVDILKCLDIKLENN